MKEWSGPIPDKVPAEIAVIERKIEEIIANDTPAAPPSPAPPAASSAKELSVRGQLSLCVFYIISAMISIVWK